MLTYLITGANRGIGLEYVRALATSSENVVFALVRDASFAHKDLLSIVASANAKIHVVECDISSPSSISSLGSRLIAVSIDSSPIIIDIVINNAGTIVHREHDAMTLNSESIHAHIQTNVTGPALLVQSVIPYLKEGSIIINVSSMLACMSLVQDGTIPTMASPYSISKAALNMLTIHQAAALREKGIVVVAMDPGHVKTAMGGSDAPLEADFSATSILKTLSGLGIEQSGKFLRYNGESIPW